MKTSYMSNLAFIRAANKELREKDDSHLWPISGKFNATERAIRRVRKTMRETGSCCGYVEQVENEISTIVNNQV